MTSKDEIKQIKNERDEMEKHMTDMFDLAFMINNHDDLMKSQEHHEKLSRMVTHYMGSIQQSYSYMSEQAIKALEQEPCWIPVSERLPTKEEYIDNNGLFIVSDGNRTYAEYFDTYNSMKYFGEPTMGGFRVDKCVTAWRSLPAPYKADSEGGERMNNTLTFNHPLSESDWDKIFDVEFEKTEHIEYITPNGKKFNFIRSDVLDKIRAEIEGLQKMCNKDDLNLMAQHSAFGMVLDVIDKYKAEQEDEE